MTTPDQRYLVVRGRLWRLANPSLGVEERDRLVHRLMQARRAVKDATNERALQRARAQVHVVKCMLGERGPVWWTDGAPDYGHHMVVNTPYRGWYEGQRAPQRAANRSQANLSFSVAGGEVQRRGPPRAVSTLRCRAPAQSA